MSGPTIADLASRTHNKMAKKKNWIKKAHLKEGAFTKQAEEAGKSVHEYAEEKKDAEGTTGKRARLALTFEGMAHKRKKSPLHSHPRSPE